MSLPVVYPSLQPPQLTHHQHPASPADLDLAESSPPPPPPPPPPPSLAGENGQDLSASAGLSHSAGLRNAVTSSAFAGLELKMNARTLADELESSHSSRRSQTSALHFLTMPNLLTPPPAPPPPPPPPPPAPPPAPLQTPTSKLPLGPTCRQLTTGPQITAGPGGAPTFRPPFSVPVDGQAISVTVTTAATKRKRGRPVYISPELDSVSMQ
ncbi:unnamed protein product [Protopolystoma xenopodis]|uniref:Uncharacterized protein n=1 Tax=Protopolystoma xenopodis TaxID=117903 RepID=A0A448XL69_9PLAT|nr:unnamed protein product [Protopolystoma xenopodis]